ncbi:hypothetical protein DWG18_12290 [Lysobacter sp. TY2-98]|uniref:hypothetical protein n=1 Tax=Lysobacter sp. TY2-98 TaxID=2290922 RepID=UPI000E205352|nr:hypothetical protein [Lysobacter sp. TY2-98]AXK72981.1 hypothetical protein DWG18_12290 [Lysobacter sp. TY2-98]
MNPLSQSLRFLVLAAATASLAACATRPPPPVSGRWTPVNHYDEQSMALPLRPDYVYYATPVDRTLKGLLARWAHDSKMQLEYTHDTDFTLYRAVAEVHSDDLRAAVNQLSAMYAAQQVVIGVDGDRIVVRRAPSTASTTAPAAPAASAH